MVKAGWQEGPQVKNHNHGTRLTGVWGWDIRTGGISGTKSKLLTLAQPGIRLPGDTENCLLGNNFSNYAKEYWGGEGREELPS